jgi:hypothetical protein
MRVIQATVNPSPGTSYSLASSPWRAITSSKIARAASARAGISLHVQHVDMHREAPTERERGVERRLAAATAVDGDQDGSKRHAGFPVSSWGTLLYHERRHGESGDPR